MHIDVFSSVIFNITSAFFMGFSLFIVTRGHLGEIRGSKRFATGLLIMFLGWSLQATIKIFPNIKIIAPFATGLIILTMVCYCHAVIEFKEIKFPVYLLYQLILLTLFLLFFFDIVVVNINARVIVVAFSAGVFAVITSYVLFAKRFNANKKIPASHKVTGYMFILCSVVLMSRVIYFSLFPIESIFAANWMQDFSYLVFNIVINVTAFSFLLMCSEKYAQMQKQTAQALRESEARLRDIFDISPAPMVLNDEANMLSVNQAFVDCFGYELPQIPTVFDWREKAYPDEKYREWVKQTWNEKIAQMKKNRTPFSPMDVVIRCKNGEFKNAVVSASFITSSKTEQNDLNVVVFHDITDRKAQELAMQQAKQAAEDLAKTKSEFLANMSHEIRTPMSAIIGFSELALNEQLSREIRFYLENIHTASKSLLGILNDILDLSKTEAGKLEIEQVEFNLNEILSELHDLFYLTAENKKLTFNFDIGSSIPTTLIGDGLRIRQVLTNLLGNALKFTKTGSVTLNLQLLEFRPKKVLIRFAVFDTGIGITPEYQEKLFTPFTQQDSSTSRHFGGTGLGLTISQKLLNLMNSQLKVESKVGQGSTFYFDLALDVPANQKAIETIYEQLAAGALSVKLGNSRHLLTKKQAKILLAEDDFINQELITRFLKLAGLSVEIACDGVEVLEKLKANCYDVILMDVNMPNMCGLEATKEIRKQEQYRDLPIIALTAGVTREEQNICLENGMNDFVEKPVNAEKLMQILVHYLEKQDSQSD